MTMTKQRDHDDEAAFAAAIYWGVGCTLYPLSEDTLQIFVGEMASGFELRDSRGDIRRLGEQLTPEEGLVLPAQEEKLVLHGANKASH